MKKVVLLTTVAALAAIAMACGGGTSSADKTSTAAAGAKPAATSAATKAAAPTVAATKAAESPTEKVEATAPAASGTSESTPTTAELSADVKQLKQIMTAVIAKAQAGDVQGTRDTEGTMDDPMEAVVKATRAVDPALADELEKLELDIEAQADASTTDLSVIIKDAQAVPAVLDKIVTALKLTP